MAGDAFHPGQGAMGEAEAGLAGQWMNEAEASLVGKWINHE
ncbi:hypothetical protein [Maricaulis salignorans]